MLIISTSTSFIIPIVFIAVVALIIFLVFFFNTKQKIIRTLSKLPMKQIGSLKTNEFNKVSGKALHIKEPLIAPFSKRKCIFFVLKIEQKKSSGKNRYWKTLVHDEKIQDFFLEKNGDYVMLRPTQKPKNYMNYLVVDKKDSSGTFNDPNSKVLALLKRYNIKSEGFFGFNKTLRYSEGVIEIGEEITVAGIAKWRSLKVPIEGYSYSKIAELVSSDKQKLIITDLPNITSKKR
ncbi:hypothetical protein [Polaribacter sp.]|uniref:hypothetical protein n=1 Tax=Polaribacter sp. TaxID=1920175 RepID=UPI003EF81F9A